MSFKQFFHNLLASLSHSLRSAGPIYTWITIWIFVGNFAGLYFIGLFTDRKSIDFGQVIIWALAIFLLGALIGIIFGVPKTISSPGTTTVAATAPASPPSSPPASNANASINSITTNLTEISDWLTKVVIGAGLVQLKELPHFVLKVADRMALGVSMKPHYLEGLCAAIIIYYLCFGLLCGYFAMRTIFTDIFNKLG